MSKLVRLTIVAASMTLAILAFPKDTQAAAKLNCDIYDVEFYAGLNATTPEPVLVVHCVNDGTDFRAYYGTNNLEGCPGITIDQVKVYTNLLTAAHLANKQVTINYTPNACGGQNTIDSIFLSP